MLLPLHDLHAAPGRQCVGWSTLAVVGLDCDVTYVPAIFSQPGEITIDELVGSLR